MQEFIRHGDVILTRVEEIPVGVKEIADRVVAEGEITGHKHVLVGKQVQVFRDGEQLFVDAKVGAVITHQEHRQLTVPRGKWRVDIQRVFDPVAERRVQD